MAPRRPIIPTDQRGPVTRAIAAMRAADPARLPPHHTASQVLRALLIFTALPAGCIAQPVTTADLAPHLKPGEFAVVDTTDREPAHGELFLVAWNGSAPGPDGGERLALVQAFRRIHEHDAKTFAAWWVGSIRNRYSPEMRQRLLAARRWDELGWSNGPYRPGMLEEQNRGRGVGVLASAFEEPKRLPWNDGGAA